MNWDDDDVPTTKAQPTKKVVGIDFAAILKSADEAAPPKQSSSIIDNDDDDVSDVRAIKPQSRPSDGPPPPPSKTFQRIQQKATVRQDTEDIRMIKKIRSETAMESQSYEGVSTKSFITSGYKKRLELLAHVVSQDDLEENNNILSMDMRTLHEDTVAVQASSLAPPPPTTIPDVTAQVEESCGILKRSREEDVGVVVPEQPQTSSSGSACHRPQKSKQFPRLTEEFIALAKQRFDQRRNV
eukprot:PhF_6_TR3721/c0_g1_i1/m.5325